jgi:RNase P subunit RPR2
MTFDLFGKFGLFLQQTFEDKKMIKFHSISSSNDEDTFQAVKRCPECDERLLNGESLFVHFETKCIHSLVKCECGVNMARKDQQVRSPFKH